MKLNQILVMSKEEILEDLNYNINKLVGKGIISISSNYKYEIYFNGLERRGLVLKLGFHDIDDFVNNIELRTIRTEQSDLIIDFVKLIQDRIDILICQCESGISRSSAVAASLSKCLFNEDEYFFKKYQPNMYVYKMIIDSYNKK